MRKSLLTGSVRPYSLTPETTSDNPSGFGVAEPLIPALFLVKAAP